MRLPKFSVNGFKGKFASLSTAKKCITVAIGGVIVLILMALINFFGVVVIVMAGVSMLWGITVAIGGVFLSILTWFLSLVGLGSLVTFFSTVFAFIIKGYALLLPLIRVISKIIQLRRVSKFLYKMIKNTKKKFGINQKTS